jgi:hypothetical protein
LYSSYTSGETEPPKIFAWCFKHVTPHFVSVTEDNWKTLRRNAEARAGRFERGDSTRNVRGWLQEIVEPVKKGSRHKKNGPGATNQKRVKEKLPAVAAVSTVPAIAAATTSTTATAIATSSTTIATTATTATRALCLRSSFIDDQVPAPEVLTVQGRNGAICVFIAGDFDEGEATRLTRETIANQTDC